MGRCTTQKINTDIIIRSAIVSRWDRLLIFGACNVGALICFLLCFLLLPFLLLKFRKFAIL